MCRIDGIAGSNLPVVLPKLHFRATIRFHCYNRHDISGLYWIYVLIARPVKKIFITSMFVELLRRNSVPKLTPVACEGTFSNSKEIISLFVTIMYKITIY